MSWIKHTDFLIAWFNLFRRVAVQSLSQEWIKFYLKNLILNGAETRNGFQSATVLRDNTEYKIRLVFVKCWASLYFSHVNITRLDLDLNREIYVTWQQSIA